MAMLLPRLTQKLCYDLAIWMVGLDLSIGLLFPFFMRWLGFPAAEVLSGPFMLASLGAGAFVAAANFLVARWVVAPRLWQLASQAHKVEDAIRTATDTNDWANCTHDKCQIAIDSADEIGESSRAFNDLVDALLLSHEVESAVNEFAHRLTSKLELEPMSAVALDRLIEHTGSAAGAVIVEQEGELRVTAQRGIHGLSDITTSEPVQRCLVTNRLVTIEVPADVEIDALLTRFRPRQIILVPLPFKGTPLGLFMLASMCEISQHAQRMLTLFKQSFALALNNAQAHDQLQRLAVIDPLTGLYNRRFGMARLGEEFQRALRANASLAALMLDIDHFKAVNDEHGHLMGDRVLTKVARTLKRLSREGDVVVRYGGEEFMILIPEADAEHACALGERMRHAVADLRTTNGAKILRVTLSIGLAAFPEQDVNTPEELIALADSALYQAKQGGRNRVQACGPVAATAEHRVA